MHQNCSLCPNKQPKNELLIEQRRDLSPKISIHNTENPRHITKYLPIYIYELMHKNCSLFQNKSLSSNPVKIHILYKILDQGQTKLTTTHCDKSRRNYIKT